MLVKKSFNEQNTTPEEFNICKKTPQPATLRIPEEFNPNKHYKLTISNAYVELLWSSEYNYNL